MTSQDGGGTVRRRSTRGSKSVSEHAEGKETRRESRRVSRKSTARKPPGDELDLDEDLLSKGSKPSRKPSKADLKAEEEDERRIRSTSNAESVKSKSRSRSKSKPKVKVEADADLDPAAKPKAKPKAKAKAKPKPSTKRAGSVRKPKASAKSKLSTAGVNPSDSILTEAEKKAALRAEEQRVLARLQLQHKNGKSATMSGVDWVGKTCRALFRGDQSFHPAEIVRYEGNSLFTVLFSKGTVQLHTKKVDIQIDEEQPEAAVTPKAASKTIWAAASSGDIAGVNQFCNEGVNVDTPNPSSGKTALVLACENGHLEIAKRLLQAGAEDKTGQAYHSAAPEIQFMLRNYGMGKAHGAVVVRRDSPVGQPIEVVEQDDEEEGESGDDDNTIATLLQGIFSPKEEEGLTSKEKRELRETRRKYLQKKMEKTWRTWTGQNCRAAYGRDAEFINGVILSYDGNKHFTVRFVDGKIQSRTHHHDVQLVDASWADFSSFVYRSAASRTLWHAIRAKDLRGVEHFLQEGVSVDERCPTTGKLPLEIACSVGSAEIAMRLLRVGAYDRSGHAYAAAPKEMRPMLREFGFGKTLPFSHMSRADSLSRGLANNLRTHRGSVKSLAGSMLTKADSLSASLKSRFQNLK